MLLKDKATGKITIPPETAAAMSAVLNSDTSDFSTLFGLTGLDPTSDLRHGDWAGVNFGFADISGWDFSGADLSRADLSGVQNIQKAIFDSETTFDHTELPRGVTTRSLLT